jgi:lipoyl-dependent peroxiredoxin
MISLSQGPRAMIKLEKVLYTAKTHSSGGRDNGMSRSSDGHLEVRLSTPGTSGGGTNPEQLFAAGWSSCMISSVKLAAHKMKLVLPADVVIDAEVDLGPAGSGYAVAARLNIGIPGVEREVAERLVELADEMCPYSRATRGNIDVVINLV